MVVARDFPFLQINFYGEGLGYRSPEESDLLSVSLMLSAPILETVPIKEIT